MAQPTFSMDHVPSPEELATLPPGMVVMTPYGQMGSDGKLIPNPATAQLYQQKVVEARQKFGATPFSKDPNAPQPPITLGRSYFNPFSGKWGRA